MARLALSKTGELAVMRLDGRLEIQRSSAGKRDTFKRRFMTSSRGSNLFFRSDFPAFAVAGFEVLVGFFVVGEAHGFGVPFQFFAWVL
jgi:hypothetical protein